MFDLTKHSEYTSSNFLKYIRHYFGQEADILFTEEFHDCYPDGPMQSLLMIYVPHLTDYAAHDILNTVKSLLSHGTPINFVIDIDIKLTKEEALNKLLGNNRIMLTLEQTSYLLHEGMTYDRDPA